MPRKTLVLLVAFSLLIVFAPGYVKLQHVKAKHREILRQIEELRRENADLIEEAERLEEDPLYLEKKAREKMRVSKKGEIVYKVIE